MNYLKEYTVKCTFAEFLLNRIHYVPSSRISKQIVQIMHSTFLKYIEKEYLYLWKEMAPNSCNNIQKSQNGLKDCIWTAWLQGEENAPEVIKLTLASIRKNSNGHRVIVLTDKNIDDYINVSTKIKQKHINGEMSNAHYADVVRIMILAKYGGLWLDATFLTTKPIGDECFKPAFFSIKKGEEDNRYVTKGSWIIGILGGCEKSIYLRIISIMLCKYWEEHSICLDYFVFDYIIAAIYKNDTNFRAVVDNTEVSNTDMYRLKKIINEAFDPYQETLLNRSQFFLLTYKNKYYEITEAGAETLYAHLLRKYCVKELQ